MLDTYMEPSNQVSAREQLESLFRNASTDVFRPIRDYDNAALAKVLEKDASRISDTDADGNTPLLLSVKVDPINYVAIEQLLKSGANADVPDSEGKTALTISAIKVDLRALELLLKGGAQPFVVDNSGKRAVDYLHAGSGAKGKSAAPKLAAIAMMAEAVAKMQNNPDVELFNLRPLHWAALADDDALMKRLLGMGASPFLPAKNGKTVFECALKKKKVWNVMLSELAIQFRQEFEKMRDRGRLTPSELIKFFEAKRMRSPEGFSLWTLSEVKPVLDYLLNPPRDDKAAPALGARQLGKLEKIDGLVSSFPKLGSLMSERASKETELQIAIDGAILLMSEIPMNAILLGLADKYSSMGAKVQFEEAELMRILHGFGLALPSSRKFDQKGGAAVVDVIARSLLDAGASVDAIADDFVKAKIFSAGDRVFLRRWLEERYVD
jgi:ankyrin repeat protein